MATGVRIVKVPEFMKVTVEGVVDLEGSKAAAAEIVRLVPASTGIGLLIDLRESPVDLSLPELVDLVAAFNEMHMGDRRKTAILTEEKRFNKAEFFAVSARARGDQVQAFTSLDGALDWLAS